MPSGKTHLEDRGYHDPGAFGVWPSPADLISCLQYVANPDTSTRHFHRRRGAVKANCRVDAASSRDLMRSCGLCAVESLRHSVVMG